MARGMLAPVYSYDYSAQSAAFFQPLPRQEGEDRVTFKLPVSLWFPCNLIASHREGEPCQTASLSLLICHWQAIISMCSLFDTFPNHGGCSLSRREQGIRVEQLFTT